MEIAVPLGIILVIIFLTLYSDLKDKKKYILKLEGQNTKNKRNAFKLINLITNLFFEPELTLRDQSRISREFFRTEDLETYGWEKTTLHKPEVFFAEEEEEPIGIDPDIFGDKTKSYLEESNSSQLKEWNEIGKYENEELMKARRNFFIENFPKKMFDILDSYNFQQFKVDDQTIKTFHARFSSLIRSKVK